MFILLILFFLLFSWLTWRQVFYGLLLIAAFLPSYLIRFQIFGVPATVLEGMILIAVLVWLIKHGLGWKEVARKLFSLKPLPLGLNRWFLATFLFLLAATISVWISPNLRAASGIWKSYFVEPLLFFAVFISTVKTRGNLNKIIWALILGGLPIALLAIIQKFTGWLIPNPFWQAEVTRRVTSFFGYPNAVALYLAPLLPLSLYLLIKAVKKNKSGIRELLKISLISFNILISFLSIVFARTAGALVALAGTAFIFGLIYKKTRWWTMGLLAAIAILISLTPLHDSFTKEVLLRGQSGVVRVNMWAETIEMLKTRPLFGAGLAGYQTAIKPWHILNWAEIYLYPHNLFLNFWSETGLLGLAAFLWLVILFFVETRHCLVSTMTKCLAASMLIILIHGIVDVPYFKNDLAVMFWLFIGMRLTNKTLETCPPEARFAKASARRADPPLAENIEHKN